MGNVADKGYLQKNKHKNGMNQRKERDYEIRRIWDLSIYKAFPRITEIVPDSGRKCSGVATEQ